MIYYKYLENNKKQIMSQNAGQLDAVSEKSYENISAMGSINQSKTIAESEAPKDTISDTSQGPKVKVL